MKTYKLSVNPNIMNKTLQQGGSYREGFVNVELTPEQLAEWINNGGTFSYQYLNEIRSSERFIGTDFLAVDVDSGLKISEAQELPLFKSSCSMMYTTTNHTPDFHRFRLIFFLPRTITKISELKAAAFSLTRRFSGDLAATDAARIFYGCRNSNPVCYDASLSDTLLDELILDGYQTRASESTDFSGSTSIRSKLPIEPTRIVRTAGGFEIPVGDIKTKTPIYCPFHNDRNPSAFVSPSQVGRMFIHCKSCRTTWYLSGYSPNDIFFDNFVNTVKKVKYGDVDGSTGVQLFDLDQDMRLIDKDRIQITNKEHLELKGLPDGITFIRSPKGTGKTTYLSDALGDLIYKYATLEQYEADSDFESDPCFFGEEKVLLIGHRKALIGDLCKRLRLNNYLEIDSLDPADRLQAQFRFGICLDSLHKVRDISYDVVVIDEVEQVLGHFLSDTLGDKRYGLFTLFCQTIRRAKKVVALDADLSWISYVTLTQLVFEYGSPNPSLKKRPVNIFLNEWQPSHREIFVYGTDSQLVDQIKQFVLEGKRIYVASNSRAKIEALTKVVETLQDKAGITIPIISITSQNSDTPTAQHFIKNIKTEILKYQVVLTSPSLSTGVDISFENGNREIDAVFGFFENQINTHFDIDQQISRVRNPGSVHVWISPRTFNFETEMSVVEQDFLHRHLLDAFDTSILGLSVGRQHDQPSPFLKMVSMLISHQRFSKNNFKHNFISLKQKQGWKVSYVADNQAASQSGRQLYKDGKLRSDQETLESLLNSQLMERHEFEAFQELMDSNYREYTEDQMYSYQRTWFELFYRQPLSEELYFRDSKGMFRKQVQLFEHVTNMDDQKFRREIDGLEHFKGVDRYFKKRHELLKDPKFALLLIYGLLRTTPIFKNGRFVEGVSISAPDLKQFSQMSWDYSRTVLMQLDIQTQSDIFKKPVQHLSKILSLLGVEIVFEKAITKKGKKNYTYCINPTCLRVMEGFVARRKEVEGWEFINREYGFGPVEEAQGVPILDFPPHDTVDKDLKKLLGALV